MTKPLRLIFCGSGLFGVPTLRAAAQLHEIVQVITQPSKQAGRGNKATPTPVHVASLELGLDVTPTENINAITLPACDVMVVIAFGQKLSEAVVNHPRLGAINLHASRLPKYRGAAPIHWAVLSGERETGNSVIRLAQTMDAGAVLAQSRLPIDLTDTTGELHERLSEQGPQLVLDTLAALADGVAEPIEQDHALASRAPKLSRADALLDFRKTAFEVARRINGLSPWPGCRVEIFDGENSLGRVTLLRAEPLDLMNGTAAAGEIDDDLNLATSDGSVRLIDLQPDGKKAMSLTAYRNGRPWKPGLRLEPVA